MFDGPNDSQDPSTEPLLSTEAHEHNNTDGDQQTCAEATSKQSVGLKRQFHLTGLIAVVVGNIIGAGIFASPQSVASYSGSTGGILVSWVVAGGIAAVGGVVFCELALTFPNNCAGEYTYTYEAFGR